MKKMLIVAIIAGTATTAANAGFWESLGFGKKTEPATLAEACDTAEIQSVCPEVVLGTKTVQECLAENVSNLSKKCAGFVKKSVIANKDAALGQVKSVKEAAAAQKMALKEQRLANKDAAAAKKSAAKQEAAKKKAEAIKALAEEKAAAKAAGNEIKDAVKETGAAAKETGQAFKEIF